MAPLGRRKTWDQSLQATIGDETDERFCRHPKLGLVVPHPPHSGFSGGVAFASRRKSRCTTHNLARCSVIFNESLSCSDPEEPP